MEVIMDIDKMIKDLDSFFANTPKEHIQNIWDEVKEYEAYGPDVDELFCAENSGNDDMQDSSEKRLSYMPLSQIVSSSLSAKA